MMCIRFQNSTWVCTEIKNVRKKGRKGWSHSQWQRLASFSCQQMCVGTMLNTAKGFFSISAINTDIKAWSVNMLKTPLAKDSVTCWQLNHSAFVFQQCQMAVVKQKPAGKLTNNSREAIKWQCWRIFHYISWKTKGGEKSPAQIYLFPKNSPSRNLCREWTVQVE